MEPVTHMLTGACLSRALGFPAKARFATVACVIAAELPDADYVYRLGGPLTYFQHHRGWTHALWSFPLQAAVITAICYAAYATRSRWKSRRSLDPAPANWPALFLMCLLALLSHILLDWTNNYGVRPFAPWDRHWYAGNLVFIVEPLLLLFLGGALLLPWILSLVNKEMGARKSSRPGQVPALIALALTAGLWTYRAVQRSDAAAAIRHEDYRSGPVQSAMLSPYPISPYRWFAIVRTRRAFETGFFDTRVGTYDTDTMHLLPRPPETGAVVAAKKSWLGRVYLDWSKYPVVTDAGTVEQLHPELDLDPAERTLRVVRFSDLRFGYPVLGVAGSANPLGAEAWVDANGMVHREFLGSAEQKLP